jgi:hypothetical protein
MKYDWEALRDEYVMGGDDVTLEVMAAKSGNPAIQTIKKHSTMGDWALQRRQYRDQVATKARNLASSREAETRVRHIKIAQAMQAKALQRLQALNPEEMDMKEVRLYLKDAAEIERRAAGIPDTLGIEVESLQKLSDEELRAIVEAGSGR